MSYNPRDLSISLRAVSSPQHILNGGPKGATFPGWFLQAYQNEAYTDIVLPVQLPFDFVKVITTKLDEIVDRDAFPGHPGASNWKITHAAEACERAMKDELLRQLEAAEKAAAKIPQLKKLLGQEA